MGSFVNRRALTVIAWVVVALIVTLNLALITLTVTGAG
jgi:manganese transport protein